MSDWSFHVNNQLTRDDHPQYARVAGPRATDPVPIGGLVAYASGPSVTTNYSASTTVFTLAANLIAGNKYLVTISCGDAQQITNASSQGQVFINDSAGLLPGGGINACIGVLALNEFIAGSASLVLTAPSTATVTFTAGAMSNAASLQITAGQVAISVTRVA